MGGDPEKAISQENYQEFLAEASDRLRFQVDFAQSEMWNLLLVNGGGILALLTLIGNSAVEFSADAIWYAFLWFALGLALSLAAYFCAFMSQYFFLRSTSAQAWNAQQIFHGQQPKYNFQKDDDFGDLAAFIGLGACFFSLICFVIGAFVSLSGIL